jgi:hypothetical protein
MDEEYINCFPEYLKLTYISLNLNTYFPANILIQQARDGYHPGRAYQIAVSNRIYDYYKSNNLLVT